MKTGEISQEKSLACVHKNTHMAYRKKYKALILKYKPYILKYMPYIFRLYKNVKSNDL